jgi:hypothetical protein
MAQNRWSVTCTGIISRAGKEFPEHPGEHGKDFVEPKAKKPLYAVDYQHQQSLSIPAAFTCQSA